MNQSLNKLRRCIRLLWTFQIKVKLKTKVQVKAMNLLQNKFKQHNLLLIYLKDLLIQLHHILKEDQF